MKQNSDKQPKIIILRGNSASGKTSVARLLQTQIYPHPLLIEQDYFRRIVIKEKDGPNVINPELILETVTFGLRHHRHIIIEGIFARKNYHSLFNQLVKLHPQQNYFFYFDIPFEETLRRHATKPEAHKYGKKEMLKWWNDHDLLQRDETLVGSESSVEETVRFIRRKIKL